MTKSLTSKFESHLSTIREAVDGTLDLRSNHKLYKKIYKHYKDLGIYFIGDSEADYQLILDCLYEDAY